MLLMHQLGGRTLVTKRCPTLALPPAFPPSLWPQSLANIAWAYATLGRAPPEPFLRHLGDAALPQLRAFEPLGLSLLVWALASLGCCHNRLFNE